MKTPHACISQFLSVKCRNTSRQVKISHRRESMCSAKSDPLQEKGSQYLAYCVTTEVEK